MSTDPTAQAREVLDAHDTWGKTIAGTDECARASDAFTSALRRNGGDLARAVIAVAELAAKHEGTARDMGTGTLGGALAAAIAQEIRDALNGVHA